jgi:hypothetical protein
MASIIPSVTPQAGVNAVIATGGTAVIAANGGINGGYITNPASASDQGISVAENLIVDPVATPDLFGNGTSISLFPGQSFSLIPGTTLPTWVNAETTSHRFTVVVF